MKKLLVLLMCVVVGFGVTACGKEKQIEDKNAKAHEAIMKVLDGEGEFAIYNDFTKKTTKETLNGGFEWLSETHMPETFWAYSYAFIDFDGDGTDEVVLPDIDLDHFLFLKYESGEVQGYVYRGHLSRFKKDGIFLNWFHKDFDDGFFSKLVHTICTVDFEEGEPKFTEKAYKCEEKDEYFIDGKAVSKQECDQYFEEWDNREAAEFKNVEYTEDGKIVLEEK